jgi:c-di-GMP-binding flagellar brake protein YcgR
MEESLQRVHDELMEPGEPPPQASPSGEQRRRFPRAPYVTPVRIQVPASGAILGRSEDISEGGLLVVADRPCPEGTPLEVQFMIPFSGHVATVAALARWARNARGKVAIGLEFSVLPESVRQEIASFVDREFLVV